MKSLITLLLSLSLAGYACGAGAPEPPAGAQSSSTSPAYDGLVVGLQLSDDGQIPEEISGTLIITNKNIAGTPSVVLKSVTVTPYGRLSGVYRPFQAVNVETPLIPQERRLFKVKFSLARDPSIFNHITFRSGPNEFIATVSYFPGGQSTARTADISLSPNVTTSKAYVIAGGLCGAILLVGFLIASKFLAAVKAGEYLTIYTSFKQLSLKWFLMTVAYALNGAVTALLLVLLSAGLGALEMPLALTLQDFSGGLVVGLFSITLGKFVAEKLALFAP